MATLTIYPYLSPRLIQVDSPTTNISIQEIVDLVRAWEDTARGLNFPHLIDATGKDNLGGGVSVGITATLQNAIISFEVQGGVDSSGTVTTLDATGVVLTDASGTFITDGIVAGDTVLNVTDGSITSVLTVDSETQLTTFGLESGTDNQFASSDAYKVWNKVACEVLGGNLVAVNEFDEIISPFLPTAQTYVTRSSSSSATLTDLNLANVVWDALTAGHTNAGTTGKALTDAGAAGNPWGSPVEGNTTAGTFGELVGKKVLTVAKFLGFK